MEERLTYSEAVRKYSTSYIALIDVKKESNGEKSGIVHAIGSEKEVSKSLLNIDSDSAVLMGDGVLIPVVRGGTIFGRKSK